MKNFKFITLMTVVALSLFVISCKKDDLENKTTIKFESTYQTAKTESVKNVAAGNIVIESFKVNIAEIEIEFNDNDPLFITDTCVTDFELEGPFEIDLLKQGETLETLIVKNMNLPTASYDEIEFEFRESDNSISSLYGKSVLIEGTIDGTPFIFWTDEEIEVEIEFEEMVYLDQATTAILTVSFDLTTLFNPLLGGVDISNAADVNQNGIIEIYPEDPDGNSDLADMIWEKIEFIIEAFEDIYDN